MSHYTVAVFTTNKKQSIDELLAPYDENIEVAPYVRKTKAQLIQDEKERIREVFDGNYGKWKHEPNDPEVKSWRPEYIEYLKSIPGRMKWPDEQLYQDAIKGYESELTEDGDLQSTYNPKSKWDWWVIGGRFSNLLLLKDKSQCDTALTSDIDFEAIQEYYASELRPYEEAMTKSFMKERYMRERFRNEEEYIKLQSTFTTYAVVTPDGEWHAPGDMGWWGMSSETPEEERAWTMSYHERFIKPAIEKGWYMTIVDCHI